MFETFSAACRRDQKRAYPEGLKPAFFGGVEGKLRPYPSQTERRKFSTEIYLKVVTDDRD